MTLPQFTEDTISKRPALHLLQQMGYTYLSPAEALRRRGGKASNVLLDEVLADWLRAHNRVYYKGQTQPFTEGNILAAVQALKAIPQEGLITTNEKIYDLLSLGKSFQQSIDGDIKSFTIKYIDWENPANNVYHVTEEYAVERKGTHATRIPDIVLFVNGIPFGVIECKSPSIKEPIKEAISQQIRNQKEDEIPELYIYSQLLLVLATNEARYATTGTPLKFWSSWQEESDSFEAEVTKLVQTPLTDKELATIYTVLKPKEEQNAYNALLQRSVTEQDRLLYALCRPERLLELTYRFVLYDNGEKKIARYQQYFCVKKIMQRIEHQQEDGRRQGGLIWHTQGSGKSLTMVLLAKAISLHHAITDYKIVLVSDRVDLDDQIYNTFHHCDREVEQAKTGKELAEMLQGSKQRIITTVIDKFDAAVGRHETQNQDPNIFVLVDESHRGQYGPRHAKMQRVLPHACYIGFTGTPVMKKDKNTVQKFGGIIDTYTIDCAVADRAVLPLLYEGRHVNQKVDAQGIDNWFARVTAGLSREQSADLKKKFATTDQLNKTEQKVKAIAWDISTHFRDTWQGTGLKGQLVTQDKATALLYKQYLDEFGIVTAEVLISGPDEREGEEDIYAENSNKVLSFWKAMMQRYGSEKQYNKQLINAFKNAEEPEIIIVVDKLLTGFDAPRNTVLYLTKKLKDHSLLQAIARVNRLYEGKDYGYILDYRGILENLNAAFDLYGSLSEFDMQDLAGTICSIEEEIARLPQRHSVLHDTFKEIQNKQDEESYEQYLADEEQRTRFYERLSLYARTLAIALSSTKFLEETTPEKLHRYKEDLTFFSKLRRAVRQRYAETVDFAEYEARIQKLLDTHVGTGEVEQTTPLVNIFDQKAFAEEIANLATTAAKADTIAHRTARTISEKMEEDPAFYRRFSDMLNDTIRMFRESRIKDNEYLQRVLDFEKSIVNRTGDEIPEKLKKYAVAKAFFGTLKEMFAQRPAITMDEESLADVALTIDEIIKSNRIVNWVNNTDVQNRMKTEIEEALFELQKTTGTELSFDEIDKIIDECISIAKTRMP